MRPKLPLLLLTTVVAALAQAADWAPTPDPAKAQEIAFGDRAMEVYHHGVKPEWGYRQAQQDTFVVIHPKTERRGAPLYVVLHSAGHDVYSCVKCTQQVGNHDIYHAPDDMYALYLDCRANQAVDWWWGGMNPKVGGSMERNSGGVPGPTERRVVDTVRWAMAHYQIDPNRVYLCGNSMGGSGTLGIGLRNGDLFAAVKANVPAGIEHVCDRMYFPPKAVPADLKLADPPVVIDYSAQNDGWSDGHELFVSGMNDRKYALYFYWGPFGHANNHAQIMGVNDLINSVDWLSIPKNAAYAAFTNASSNDKLPWPDNRADKAAGQVNAWFRYRPLSDTATKVELALSLTSADDLKTRFTIPTEATADVTLRRLQKLRLKPGQTVTWTYGAARGRVTVAADGAVTVPGLRIGVEAVTLAVAR
ncbi:MAG: hypothetical protein HZB16_22155 [Armatimonadetes bacterium]|nr:hypothetical protein [Armatimonadota bacterium]